MAGENNDGEIVDVGRTVERSGKHIEASNTSERLECSWESINGTIRDIIPKTKEDDLANHPNSPEERSSVMVAADRFIDPIEIPNSSVETSAICEATEIFTSETKVESEGGLNQRERLSTPNATMHEMHEKKAKPHVTDRVSGHEPLYADVTECDRRDDGHLTIEEIGGTLPSKKYSGVQVGTDSAELGQPQGLGHTWTP